MSRSEIKPTISIEDIIRSTNGGEEIFSRFLPKISFTENVSAPWRKDSVPSLRLSRSNNKITFTDFGGNQASGDCIDFVKELYGLSFKDSIEMIKKDFNIDREKVFTKVIRKIVEDNKLVEVNTIKFQERHRKYWNKYLLSEEDLRKEDIFAISAYAINKKANIVPPDVATFGYYAKDVNKWKILQIGNVPKKWINFLPNSYIWRFDKVQNAKRIFLVKSLKDAVLLNKHFNLDTVALQNESAKIYLGSNAERMENITKDIVCLLGTDEQGKAQSIEITKARGYKWFNTENYMLKYSIEDPSDLVAEFGLEPLKQLLIKKNYI